MFSIQGIRCFNIVLFSAVMLMYCVHSQVEWCGMPQPLCMCDVHQGIVLCTRRDIVSVPQFPRAIRRRSWKVTFHNTGIYSLLQMGSDWPQLKQVELLGNKHLVCGKVKKDVRQLKFQHVSLTGDCTDSLTVGKEKVVSSVGPGQKQGTTIRSVDIETNSLNSSVSPWEITGNTQLITVSYGETTGNPQMSSISQGKHVEGRPTHLAFSSLVGTATVYMKPAVSSIFSQTDAVGERGVSGSQVGDQASQLYDKSTDGYGRGSQEPEDEYLATGAEGAASVQLVAGVVSGVLMAMMLLTVGTCALIWYRRRISSRSGRRGRRMNVEMQQLFLNEAFQETNV